jgi:hypothetical protein
MLGLITTNLHYLQKPTILFFLFFIPVYKYKVRSNLRPQSATQLHANIQLESLVTSWPSFYMSYITLLIITIYGCGLHGRDSLATPPGVCALQPLMEALCIVPADPHFPFYAILLYFSISSNR